MSTKVSDYLAEKIVWRKTQDPKHPFVADHEGEECVVRLNDFPDEHLYTLIINGVEIADLDDWPGQWSRPDVS